MTGRDCWQKWIDLGLNEGRGRFCIFQRLLLLKKLTYKSAPCRVADPDPDPGQERNPVKLLAGSGSRSPFRNTDPGSGFWYLETGHSKFAIHKNLLFSSTYSILSKIILNLTKFSLIQDKEGAKNWIFRRNIILQYSFSSLSVDVSLTTRCVKQLPGFVMLPARSESRSWKNCSAAFLKWYSMCQLALSRILSDKNGPKRYFQSGSDQSVPISHDNYISR